jgi:putative redox protein
MSSPTQRRPIIVTHEGGLQFAAQVRGHRIVVDQPAGTGDDVGPMPIELLGTALGTCIALYVQQFCDARGLPHEGMRVELQQFSAQNPSRIGRFEVRVILPEALPAHYAGMLERVARSCPAHHTFEQGAEVDVKIEVADVITVE